MYRIISISIARSQCVQVNLYETIIVCVSLGGRDFFFFLSHLGAKVPTEGRTANGFVSCCVNTLLHTSNPHEQETGRSWAKEDSLCFLPKSFDSCPLSYRNDLKRKPNLCPCKWLWKSSSTTSLLVWREPWRDQVLLRDGRKLLLHGHLPADPQEDHWPTPKPPYCVPGPENPPWHFPLHLEKWACESECTVPIFCFTLEQDSSSAFWSISPHGLTDGVTTLTQSLKRAQEPFGLISFSLEIPLLQFSNLLSFGH